MQYFVVDAMNLAYRAHSVNFELKTSTDIFSGMFFGFVRTILSLKKKYRGHKFIVVWDNKPQAKYDLQPDYKAGRASMPSGVFSQIEDIQNFLKHSGVDQYSMPGEEADDVIATLSEELKKNGTVIIYTNDKDMLQLVEDGKVVVFKPKVGMSPEKFYDEEAVKEQFGVPPKKLAIYRSFDGDASDNIRGVERVPRKIIAKLVNVVESVSGVYTALESESLTDFQKKSFDEARDRIFNNEKIVTLNKNLVCKVCVEASVDKAVIEQLFKKFEIRSIDPTVVVDIFSSVLNLRYSEARPTVKVESYSLF
jgi:DNA polymerase-1